MTTGVEVEFPPNLSVGEREQILKPILNNEVIKPSSVSYNSNLDAVVSFNSSEHVRKLYINEINFLLFFH